jgi:hypothetical protein
MMSVSVSMFMTALALLFAGRSLAAFLFRLLSAGRR